MVGRRVGKFQTFSFYLSPEVISTIDAVVERKGFDSRSALIELILRQHLKELIKDGKI